MNNYPTMSQVDWKNAPFNEEDIPEEKVDVTVSVTLSKTVRIKVSDYSIVEYLEDGTNDASMYLDFTNCDLKNAVNEQIVLPQDTFKDWNLDDYEVILEG